MERNHLSLDVGKDELLERISSICEEVNKAGKPWDAVLIVDKVNQFYLTGTMQNALFIIKPDGSYAYFVKSSFHSAKAVSPLDNIYEMSSYRDILEFLDHDCSNVYIESEIMTYAMLGRIKKYLNIENIIPIDKIIMKRRSLKSSHEISIMRESGRQHQYILEKIVPGILKEGMSEAELTYKIYSHMIELGHQGVIRFSMFQTELVIGQIGFGESSITPVCFDGPGGNRSICSAVQAIGSRERKLKKGDLVFVDIGYGVGGYHTDRTQLYMFGDKPSEKAREIHKKCMEIERETAAMLRPGEIAQNIYKYSLKLAEKYCLDNFMGFGNKRVKFLGHGVGLQIDEYPVIANNFSEPLQENMVIALEPKNGLSGVGLLGVEDTYIVTKNGGEVITGWSKDIMVI